MVVGIPADNGLTQADQIALLVGLMKILITVIAVVGGSWVGLALYIWRQWTNKLDKLAEDMKDVDSKASAALTRTNMLLALHARRHPDDIKMFDNLERPIAVS